MSDRPLSVSRPRVGVSACLMGEAVRWDGGDKFVPQIVSSLRDRVELVPVCPELEVGMGVPREPVNLVEAAGGPRMIGVRSGRDWTEEMLGFARRRASELNVRGFVLKSRSPSCGLQGVPLQGTSRQVPGMFAAVLRSCFPGMPMAEETDLSDQAALDAFVSEVHTYARMTSTGPSSV